MKSNNVIWLVVIGVVLVGGYFLLFDRSNTTSLLIGSDEAVMMKPIEVGLETQSGLGQSGTATLSQNEAGMLVVTLAMSGGNFSEPQPAHIHLGACPKPGAVEQPLTNVVNGISVTTLPVSWDDLVASGEPMAINVHKSAAESSVYTACGDLPLDVEMEVVEN